MSGQLTLKREASIVAAQMMGGSNLEISASLRRYYRPEIDGLRTIAVVAVILNHFDRNALPLGYL